MSAPARLTTSCTVALAAVVLAACGVEVETTTVTSSPGGDESAAAENGGSAFIDPGTGEFSSFEPDERRGTTPEPQQEADLEKAAEGAGCELQLDLKDEGNDHIPENKQPRYGTEPPTSGPHHAVPLADGAYLDSPEARFFVHSMEHGRVVILYQPDLPEADQLALKGVFDEDPEGMVLLPYEDMPYEVAIAAWTNFAGCDSYDPAVIDVVRAFRDAYRGNGPEAVPL